MDGQPVFARYPTFHTTKNTSTVQYSFTFLHAYSSVTFQMAKTFIHILYSNFFFIHNVVMDVLNQEAIQEPTAEDRTAVFLGPALAILFYRRSVTKLNFLIFSPVLPEFRTGADEASYYLMDNYYVCT